MDIDFEGKGDVTQTQTGGDNNGNLANQPDTTSLDNKDNSDITGKDNTNTGDDNKGGDDNGNKGDEGGKQDNSSSSPTGELEAGTEVEFDGTTYTVDADGNIVDKDGKIFVEAKDVDNWLKENNATEGGQEEELSIENIIAAVGTDVTDENGKPVEFTNDAAGVKSYIDSVISIKSNDIAQGAVNKLFANNPLLKQFIDYVSVTGSPKGFGDIPDRSGIKLDKDNKAQQEAIIRIAAQEFGNKSVTDTYIKYLTDSGSLYDEAKSQLEALVGKDKAYRAEIEKQANAKREQDEKEINEYWQNVNNAIANKVIGNYKLPDNIVKEVNGQKVTYTLNDFYDYLSKPAYQDTEGNVLTAYQKDLNALSDEETLNKELLDAWLTFTGGSYKDLINMAVKEDAVRKLIIKSKQQRSTRTVKVNKPKSDKVDFNDLLLG